jgi:hypothetical protein
MRGTDFTRTTSGGSGASGDDARLDKAIERADDLLLISLKADERRRTRGDSHHLRRTGHVVDRCYFALSVEANWH